MIRQQTFTAVFQRSGDWWAAWIEELPGANTQGATLEEAHANLLDAAQMLLDDDAEQVAYEEQAEFLPGSVIRESLTVTV